MDNFIEKYNLPKLNQEEPETLKTDDSCEIEAVIRKLSAHRCPKHDSFTGVFL